jgi:hypothetical protein
MLDLLYLVNALAGEGVTLPRSGITPAPAFLYASGGFMLGGYPINVS